MYQLNLLQQYLLNFSTQYHLLHMNPLFERQIFSHEQSVQNRHHQSSKN
jgi:hypothetical protein